MNGDEIVGPNVAVYFIEYVCSMHRNGEPLQSARLNQLLDNVEIFIMPMPNTVGYNYREANERLTQSAKDRVSQKTGRQPKDSIDVQEDFPIDQQSDEECLNSVASRILYKLMTTNKFSTVVSLRTGGNNILHPWGTFHRSQLSDGFYEAYMTPDSYSFDYVGEKMRHSAGKIVYTKNASAS